MSNKEPQRFQVEYWMVTCEYDRIIEMPRDDGIIGEPKRFLKRETINQAISVHPIIHGIAMLQQGFQNFVITFAMPVPKKYFDLVVTPTQAEKKVNEVISKIAEENAAGLKPVGGSDANSTSRDS